MLADLTVLDMSTAANRLARDFIEVGAVPQNLMPDAQHIAIATVNSIEYLVSWNYKHIVNETKRQLINEACHAAGFQPTTLCTPIELVEGIQMKEKIDTRMDPVLEECYRMKEAFAAKFDSMQELYDYLVAETEKIKHSVGNIFRHRSLETKIIKRSKALRQCRTSLSFFISVSSKNQVSTVRKTVPKH